ncbi:MAG TPA: DUF4087 domain-containing protein [Pyrinomonadaceae bacterium]|nr:DUF4087 domain-containing protein [Pyrinomonadaceae bacterium]
MNHKVITSGLLVVSTLLAVVVAEERPRRRDSAAIEPLETRCGWFSNPTPANASLYDRDGEWIIAVQGGYQAEGDWPTFGPNQWVETNVHYGYGCACLKVQVDRDKHQIMKIEGSKARPLSVCRRDRSLKRWSFK